MLPDFNNSFTVRTWNYLCGNLIAVTYYLPVCYLMTSVWRHSHLKLCSFCVEKHRTSFLQTCGLQTVQISIQLTMRSGLWCSVMFTRRKFTPSTNWSSGWLKSGAALNSRLLIWLLSIGVKDLELVCVRKEDTSNIAFELADRADFVNHLSLLCNCVMLCLNIRSLSKTTLL